MSNKSKPHSGGGAEIVERSAFSVLQHPIAVLQHQGHPYIFSPVHQLAAFTPITTTNPPLPPSASAAVYPFRQMLQQTDENLNDSGLGDRSILTSSSNLDKSNNMSMAESIDEEENNKNNNFDNRSSSSSPQKQQQKFALAPPPSSLPAPALNGQEIYCTVPGRLTLLSNLKKYRVSIAEIQRRLGPPECLNASILGGILRKAKNKDGGRLLREQLMTYGVELASGRRKQGPLTCFSSLVEEEAVQLAVDFNTINQKHYPSKAAVDFFLTDVQNSQDASMCRMELYYASKFLTRILDFHRADLSPSGNLQVKHEPMEAILSVEQQQALTNYSFMTHSFGSPAWISVLEKLLTLISECNQRLIH